MKPLRWRKANNSVRNDTKKPRRMAGLFSLTPRGEPKSNGVAPCVDNANHGSHHQFIQHFLRRRRVTLAAQPLQNRLLNDKQRQGLKDAVVDFKMMGDRRRAGRMLHGAQKRMGEPEHCQRSEMTPRPPTKFSPGPAQLTSQHGIPQIEPQWIATFRALPGKLGQLRNQIDDGMSSRLLDMTYDAGINFLDNAPFHPEY